jgi:MFS family permease
LKPVLRIPAFRRLLAAYALNELAFMIGMVALTLLVYKRTGSAWGATAFFLSSQFVPALISPMLVARLDQLPSRPVLPAMYWLEAVIFIALAALAGRHFGLVSVLALSFLNGVIALTARSLARAATVTVTSAADLLREGNAVVNAAFSVCFMLGPAIGGTIVATAGTAPALLGVSGLFALIGLTLAGARGLPEPSPVRDPSKGRLQAALTYARERPAIRVLLILQAGGVLFFTISVPVEVVFAQHSLHAGAAGYGAMLSAWGAGAVAGAAVYARWRARPNRELIALGAGLLGLGFMVMAAAPTLVVAVAGGALAGVGNGIESVASRTAIQEETDGQWMALVMSLQESIYQSFPGAGMLIGGSITALGSPRTALAVAGVGSLAITAVVWVVLGRLEPATDLGIDVVTQADPPGGAAQAQPGGAHRCDGAPTPVLRDQ